MLKRYTVNNIGGLRYKLFKPILWILKTLGFKGRESAYMIFKEIGKHRYAVVSVASGRPYCLSVYYPDPEGRQETTATHVSMETKKFNDPIFVSLLFKLDIV